MSLAELLNKECITEFGAVKLEYLTITKERLIKDAPTGCVAVMMAVPYPKSVGKAFAAFSLIPDYHIFFSLLEEKIKKYMSEKYGDCFVKVFADHSPLDERDAACKAGLGVLGDNGLFISEKYGSFVFIGEIICSLSEKELEAEGIGLTLNGVRGCLHCGKCREACPSGAVGGDKNLCVSHLTQKKGILTDTEADIIRKSSYVWGCDICAAVCPMNDASGEVGCYNDFFTSRKIDPESYEFIEKMTDEEYRQYPFSWRKRELIKRNFDLYFKSCSSEEQK